MMKGIKSVMLLLAGVAALALVHPVPSQEGAGTGPQAALTTSGSIDQSTDSRTGECSAPRPAGDAVSQSCQNCPRKLEGCGRVSCEPCCFRCPGDPILRCF